MKCFQALESRWSGREAFPAAGLIINESWPALLGGLVAVVGIVKAVLGVIKKDYLAVVRRCRKVLPVVGNTWRTALALLTA